MQSLHESSTLDILHCAGAFGRRLPSEEGLSPFLEDGIMGLPSFVPDWTAVRRHGPLLGMDRFRAGFCTTAPTRDLKPCQLRVSGIILDSVKAKTPRFPVRLLTENLPMVIEQSVQLYEKCLCKGRLKTEDLERIALTLVADNAVYRSHITFRCGPRPSVEELERANRKAENQTGCVAWVPRSGQDLWTIWRAELP
jgi:hypothetical protein